MEETTNSHKYDNFDLPVQIPVLASDQMFNANST
jgi:hypothetical protein